MNNKKITVFFFMALLAISLNGTAAFSATYITPTDGTTVENISGNKVITPHSISNSGYGNYALSTYSQFTVGAGNKAIMVLPGSVKYYINRCDNNPFNIYGTLESRLGSSTGNIGGHLVFISPLGINIGPSATINTGSLTLSTSSSTVVKDQNGNIIADLNTITPSQFYLLNLDPSDIIVYGNIASMSSGYINSSAKIINQGVINTYTSSANPEATSVDFIAGSIENRGTIGGDNSIVNFDVDGVSTSFTNKTDSVNLIVANKATNSGGVYELNEGVSESSPSIAFGSAYLAKDSVLQGNHVNIYTLSNNPSSSQYDSTTLLQNTPVNIEGQINAYALTDDSQVTSGVIDINAESQGGSIHSMYIADGAQLNASGDNSQINITGNKVLINSTGSTTVNSGGDINLTASGTTFVSGHNVLKAGKDVNINATISSVGSNEAGDITVSAGNDINITTTGSTTVSGNNVLNAGNIVSITASESHIGSSAEGLQTVYSGNNINIRTSGASYVSGYSTLKSGNDINITASESHIGSASTSSSTIISAGSTNISSTGDTIISGYKAIQANEDVNVSGHQVDIGSSGANAQTVYAGENLNITANDGTSDASSSIFGDNTLKAGNNVNIVATNLFVQSGGNRYTSTDFGALTDEPSINAGNDITLTTGAATFTGHAYLKSDNGNINITSDTANGTILFDAIRNSSNTPTSYAPVLKAKNITINSTNGEVQVFDRTKFIAANQINISGKTGVQIKNTTQEAAISGATTYAAGGLAMYTNPTGSINILSDGTAYILSQDGGKTLFDSGNITIDSAIASLYTDVLSRNRVNAAGNVNISANSIYLAGYSYLKGQNINLSSTNMTNITNYFHLPNARGFGTQTDSPLIKAMDSIIISSAGNISLRGNNYLLAGADPSTAGRISISGRRIVLEPDSYTTFCDYSILKGKSVSMLADAINVLGRSKIIATNGPISLVANNNIVLANSQYEYDNYNVNAPIDSELYQNGRMNFTGLALVAHGENGSINLESKNNGIINISTSPDSNNLSPVKVSLISGNNTISMKSGNINETFGNFRVINGNREAVVKQQESADQYIESVAKSTNTINPVAPQTGPILAPADVNPDPNANPSTTSFVSTETNATISSNTQVSTEETSNSAENAVLDKPATNNKVKVSNSKKENDKDNKNEQTAQIVQQNSISIKGKKIDNYYGDSYMNSLVKNNSMENEYRADLNAVNETAKMGYHPAGIAGFLISVKSIEDNKTTGNSSVNNLFAYRHPGTSERLGRIEGQIKGLNNEEFSSALINKQEFNNVMSILKR